MVNSMTGYGRYEVLEGERRIIVEMKSVNNRYLDINIRMPKLFNPFDTEIRALMKKDIKRGKVDVYITHENLKATDLNIRYNADIASRYMELFNEMSGTLGIPNDVTAGKLSSMPDVFKLEEAEVDDNLLHDLLIAAVEGACGQFAASRRREGSFLQKDLEEKLIRIVDDVEFITARSPQIIAEYEQKLNERIRALLKDKQIDESRILTEVAIFADKSGIDEELVRLKSHVDAVRDTLEMGDDKEGIGRKLDFMIQEMNRESNTILSKSSDMEITNCAVDLKTEIEKIREQVQNIE